MGSPDTKILELPVRALGDIRFAGLCLSAKVRMRIFCALLALVCGLVSRPLFGLFPAPSALPIMWLLGAVLSALIIGDPWCCILAPAGLLLGFLVAPPPVSLPEQIVLVLAVAASALTIAGMQHRSGLSIRPGMMPKEIGVLSLMGGMAAWVMTCAWAAGFALVRKVFPPTDVFAGALLRLGLSVLIWLPLLVAWICDPPRWPGLRRALHFSAMLLATVVNSAIVYLSGLHDALAWTVLPLLVWAALAFHARGVTVFVAIVAFIALYASTHGLGPFYPHDTRHVWEMEFFVATLSVMMLLLARLADKRQTEEAWREARHAAEEASARYRAVFDQTQVGIARSTLDRRFFEANQPACAIAGRSREEMLSLGPKDITLAADWEAMQQATREMLEGRRASVEREERIVTGDGQMRWVALNVSLVRSQAGEPVEFVSMVQDITARKKAEFALAESEARWRLAQELAGVGTWFFHGKAGTGYFSPLSQKHFGLRPDPAGSYGLADIPSQMGSAFGVFDSEIRRAVRENATFDFKLAVGGDGNETRWIRVLGGHDPDGEDSRILGLTMDITGQVEAEARLQSAREQVVRVSRLSAMGAMASTLAHELNQPLSAITSYCSAGHHLLVARNNAGDQRVADILREAAAQALRAGEIIRKMRRFTVTGEVSLTPESLNDVLLKAVGLVRERGDSAGARIHCQPCPGPVRVMADRIQLEQVVINLVTNAVQATAGCAVREVLVSAAPDGDAVTVSVADSGIGIPPDMRDNLFEPFRTTKEKGLGLGLPICRTIIEAHGGRLWAQANSPRGSVFRFTLIAAAQETV
ncbi:MAG TPA: ATP-binding protein [Rhizomicrobium sp.]